MNKVAIYCRLSDEDRDKSKAFDESESIQNQKMLLTKYALDKGWAIYKIYSDDDYSGLDKDRPEFSRMIQDAQNRKFEIVLCKNQSRFTRDMELVEKYLHTKFIEWGIRFVSLTDNADTWDQGNKKSRQINGLVNEWYCEDISEAIKATFKMKREEGKFIGSFAPYGYQKDPIDNNKLVIDEEAAVVVKMIYDWYLEGYGSQHIANMLNERNIPNPTKYKQMTGLSFINASENAPYGLWNKITVGRILKNEVYIGHMLQAKRRKVSYKSKKTINTPQNEWIKVKNTHEPIIEERIFRMVQHRIRHKVKSAGDGQAHIFAAKLRCMGCQHTMNKVTAGGQNSRKYVYLRCKLYAAAPSKHLCSSHTIRMDQLLKIVEQKMRMYIESLCDEQYMINQLQHEMLPDTRLKRLEDELRKIKKEIEGQNQYIRNLYIDKVKGIIAEHQFFELNQTFINEKEKLQRRENVLMKEMEEWNREAQSSEKWKALVKKYIDFTDEARMMVSKLIDYIEIGEKDKDTGEQKIRIHWLF